jgi:hypothetical protein
MKKGIFIVAGLLLVGGLGFLYLKNKKKATLPSDTAGTPATLPTPTTGAGTTTNVNPPTEKPVSVDDLLAITKLKDAIISDISTRNGYKKASSRANVQAEIDKKMATLKTYGFILENNNLVKITK